jgi:phenylacetate-coenzyme A ligase PaaK-like adenylate-forming protein
MKTMKRYIFGNWQDDSVPLTSEAVIKICEMARSVRCTFADYPLDQTLDLLDRVRDAWRRADYAPRKRALELLPGETGFSPAMIKLGVDYIYELLDPKALTKKLDVELRGIPRQYHFHFDPDTSTLKQWQPVGVMLHVLAGNVFLGGLGSLVEGLITGNVTILKMASAERVFLPLFVESLLEHDKDGIVSKSIAVIDYSSSQNEVVQTFKNEVDGIVVWGGEEAVRGYRDSLPARTRLIVFGPKLSLALITHSGLAAEGVDLVASQLADELAIWDQNACTAPQTCYVEGDANADQLIEALATALERKQRELPIGEVDLQTAIEIRKIRTLEEGAEIRGVGKIKASSPRMEWTVWKGRELALETSPLNRSLSIVPYSNSEDILGELRKLRGYIQTVGLVADAEEHWAIQKSLMAEGAVRILPIGRMAGGQIDDPHDGAYDLPQYLNLVFTRMPSFHPQIDPIDTMPESFRLDVINQRLRELLAAAKRAPFYREYKKLDEVKSVKDLGKLPILTADLMNAGMPPQSTSLQTRDDWFGGYVSRSGGSTGEPKFSVYDGDDWRAMIGNACRIFRALGLQKGDRLANCMLAGDLYGGFVSFDHINTQLGVTTFAIGHALSKDLFYKLWKNFGVNVIQGVPAAIIPVLRAIKAEHAEFTLEKIIYAGQPMAKVDRSWLMQELKAKRVSSVIGANDGGQIAYQCEEMKGNMHHVVDDFNYLEILDEHGRPCLDGTPGRIIITSLLKRAFPLIRYEIGDQGMIVPGKCSCGRTSRRLEFLGRSGDDLSLGLLNIKVVDFENALDDMGFSVIQLVGKGSPHGEVLAVNVETDRTDPDLKQQIYERLVSRMEKLKHRLDEKTLYRLEIHLCRPGELARNPRTGKVKKVIDER